MPLSTRWKWPRSLVVTVAVALAISIVTATLSWRTREARNLFRSRPDSFTFSILVEPAGEAGQDSRFELRSVLLYTRPIGIEPQALGPSGAPLSTDSLITDTQAGAIVEILARDGFFERANVSHEVPTRSSETLPRIEFQVSGRRADDTLPTDYVESFDWDPAVFSRLARIRGVLDGDAAKALGTLIDEVEETLRPVAG